MPTYQVTTTRRILFHQIVDAKDANDARFQANTGNDWEQGRTLHPSDDSVLYGVEEVEPIE